MYVYSLFGFFSIRVYYRMQNIVPCAIQCILVVHLIFKIILFIFWLRWVFIAVLWLSLVAESVGYSSLQWLLLLRSTGSRVPTL